MCEGGFILSIGGVLSLLSQKIILQKFVGKKCAPTTGRKHRGPRKKFLKKPGKQKVGLPVAPHGGGVK